MKRGEVYDARLDPVEGSEQRGSRPVVVVSRDAINESSPVVSAAQPAPAFDRSVSKRYDASRKSARLTFLEFSLFMSNALVKLQRKGQMVIPRSLREEAGVAEGTLLKVAVVKGGQFLVTPQFTIDRSVIADRHKDPKQAFRELARVVAEIRQEAKEKGIDKMPMSEINAAVAAARKALQKKTPKRRVK